MHRIHAYPAKFPLSSPRRRWHMPDSAGSPLNRIADVFCGCGTTALEAKRLNTAFWGCDINPVATLIARVKREDYQLASPSGYGSRVLHSFDRGCPNRQRHQQHDERLRYWYGPRPEFARLHVSKRPSNPYLKVSTATFSFARSRTSSSPHPAG